MSKAPQSHVTLFSHGFSYFHDYYDNLRSGPDIPLRTVPFTRVHRTLLPLHATFAHPPPPQTRVRLVALKELRFDLTASTCGILDHLILAKCKEMMLKGMFTGEEVDIHGDPAARIHPSSIDHLPVTRGITRAVAMPNACVLSGPNGCLRFWFFQGNCNNFDAGYFTSLSPISVSEIRELLVGTEVELFGGTSNLENKLSFVSVVPSKC